MGASTSRHVHLGLEETGVPPIVHQRNASDWRVSSDTSSESTCSANSESILKKAPPSPSPSDSSSASSDMPVLSAHDFERLFSKYIKQAHESAYGFNKSTPRRRTLARRREIGKKYDYLAGLARLAFQALLAQVEIEYPDGSSPDAETERLLRRMQVEWSQTYCLAASWGAANPQNDPQSYDF
ncbi:hypothetical protein M422DRAFT_24619 [Sphaerobolus stellatus SS14]|nr:hypothetical protein M422DRAFT_24619 [Sphaerobolus stellatus SS14]